MHILISDDSCEDVMVPTYKLSATTLYLNLLNHPNPSHHIWFKYLIHFSISWYITDIMLEIYLKQPKH